VVLRWRAARVPPMGWPKPSIEGRPAVGREQGTWGGDPLGGVPIGQGSGWERAGEVNGAA
jgi:hypothetical protein